MSNSKDLAKLIEKHKAEWPSELTRKAEFARRALYEFENHPTHAIEAMKAVAPNAWTQLVTYLTDFAEAYGAWKAGSGK